MNRLGHRAAALRGVVLATLLAPLACGELGPEIELLGELGSRRATWAAKRPYAYVYTLRRSCFCGPESLGPVRVSVEGDVVVERTYADTAEPVPAHLADLFPTVEGLFALVDHALASGAHEVAVEYEPALGFPQEVWIDYRERIADDELGLSVTSFPVDQGG